MDRDGERIILCPRPEEREAKITKKHESVKPVKI